jgi:hypothetical protein
MIEAATMSKPTTAKMEVVEYVLGEWYLFSQGEDFYLDVRTGLHGYGFWLLLKLEPLEAEGYVEDKKIFLRALVKGILQSPLSYFVRNASIDTQKIAFEALTAWRHGPRRPRV